MIFIPRMMLSEINFHPVFNKNDVSREFISEFEKRFERYIGCKEAFAVSSARAGLYLILKAINLKKGDEIILPSYTFSIMPNLLICMGIKPIFVDIDEKTHNLDAYQIEKNITKYTKAIIPTHIEGNPCEMDKILAIARKYNLKVIEDCAHSLGAEYKNRKTGSFGDAAIFSFGVGKEINTLGGGMICLNDKRISEKLRRYLMNIRENKTDIIKGKILRYKAIRFASNKVVFPIIIWPVLCLTSLLNLDLAKNAFEDNKTFRKIPDSLVYKYSQAQAKLGLFQIDSVERKIAVKNRHALLFGKQLSKGIKRQIVLNEAKSSFLHYVIRSKNRDKEIKKLLLNGIDTQPTWMKSCSSMPYFEKYKRNCPISDKIEKEAIYLPIYTMLKEKEIEYISNKVNKAFLER